MKKILLYILLALCYIGYSQSNPIEYKINFKDTIWLNKPVIYPDGDTITFLLKNDSLHAVINSGDTVNVERGGVSGSYTHPDYITLDSANIDTLKVDFLIIGGDTIVNLTYPELINVLKEYGLPDSLTTAYFTSLSLDTTKTNIITSKDSDSIIIDSTVYFNDGIKIKTVTESFSVSKTISYDAQYYAEMTITNNTAITVEDIPEGTSPQLALIWSGGDYTATISGATQMSGNSSTVLQEVDGATDLVQFKIINGTVYYSIINIVTP